MTYDDTEWTADEGLAPPPPNAVFTNDVEPRDGDMYEDEGADPDLDPTLAEE